MKNFLIFLAASIAEIAGCFAFWAILKSKQPFWWAFPGVVSLCLFAYFLTLTDSNFAGRAYAAYGAIYICSSIAWMWIVEHNPPNRFDVIGALICIVGAIVIIAGRNS